MLQVFKVVDSVKLKEENQIRLKIGDYVYIEESNLKNVEGDWIEGTSWLTGLTTFMSMKSLNRIDISQTWTTIM